MSNTKSKKEKTIHIDNFFEGRISRRIETSIINVISFLIFGVLGYFLDVTFDKKPLFLIVGIIVSFIIAQMVIVKRLKKYAQKLTKEK